MTDLLQALGAAIERAREARRAKAADLIVCDSCEQETDEWQTCIHGWTYCRDCGLCRDCAIEERRP